MSAAIDLNASLADVVPSTRPIKKSPKAPETLSAIATCCFCTSVNSLVRSISFSSTLSLLAASFAAASSAAFLSLYILAATESASLFIKMGDVPNNICDLASSAI